MVYALSKKLEIVLKALNVLIRCDASIQIGLGHVTRCLVLANELKAKGHNVYFAQKDYELGIQKVTEQGFHYFLPPMPFNYHQWITSLAAQLSVNIFIGDVRDGLAIKTIESLKQENILTVAIDEPSDYRKACDLCFYPPHAQLSKLDWSGFTGEIKQGLEYVLLRPEFYSKNVLNPAKKTYRDILVMMGGTDPMRLTLPIINKLLMVHNIKIHTIISQDHPDRLTIINTDTKVYYGVSNMCNFLKTINYAVISFGVTAYELIALGIPATHILLNSDHKTASQYFYKQKLAMPLHINNIKENPTIIEPTLNINRYGIEQCLIVKKILKEARNAV